jgi:hypothetical protein
MSTMTMTRNYFLTPIAVLGITLGGCAAIKGWAQDPKLMALETAVQQAAIEACGYLPDVAAVSAIILAGNPLLNLPMQIAAAICAAVTPPSTGVRGARAVAAEGVVAGVRVTGVFVK